MKPITCIVSSNFCECNKQALYTADQLREAHVRALKTAYRHVLCLPAKARVSDVLDELRRMADELEKAT